MLAETETSTQPIRLRAVETLRAAGWCRQAVAKALGISLRTVDRRLREIEQKDLESQRGLDSD
jgi:transposase